MHFFFSCLPYRLQDIFGYIKPEWILPSTIILKALKTDWDTEKYYPKEKERERKLELQREIETYREIKAFQGSLYPRFFGEVEVIGIQDLNTTSIPGILISDIGGKTPCEVEAAELSAKRLRQLLTPPIRESLAIGKELTDLKLDNFHLVKDPSERVMAFDFGDIGHRRSGDVDAICKELVSEVVQTFKEYSRDGKALLALGIKL